MKTELRSVYNLGWKPRILIEASAGTGKTYTIAALFIRLLVEKNLDISQVLIMTFTRKATSELRARIFKQLRDCLHVLEAGPGETEDSFLKEFEQRVDNKPEAIRRLCSAILNFDENQVTTIHGFCQKVLVEESLIAGTPIDVDITQHDELLEQASEDYWRLFMDRHSGTDAGRYYITRLLELANTPQDIKSLVEPLLSKPYAAREGDVFDDPVGYLDEAVRIRKKMVEVWSRDEANIRGILSRCAVSRFQQHLASRLNKLVTFLEDNSFARDSPQSLGFFISDYLYDDDNLPKTGNPVSTERHPFFELCNRYFNHIQQINKVKTSLIHDAAREISSIRNKLSTYSSTVTYNDLLINLQRSLLHPQHGKKLAAALLEKYPYALVDEFQDTDPIQFDILNAIYPGSGGESGLLMIGDPKQAIYAFRGADVYTYFKARESAAGDMYTLQKNYRSTPLLIDAVNRLFGGDHQPFLEGEIEYFRSQPGKPETANEFELDGEPGGYFKITAKRDIETNKEEVRTFVYGQTVKEISQLLDLAESGKAKIRDRKLMGGDIAVLVSGHKDAEEIKRMLKTIGVDSVTQSRQKVFETFEAHRIGLLMDAVLDPLHRVKMNNAVTSGFFGIDLAELYELKEAEGRRQHVTEELQELNEIWQKKGFYAMFRSLLVREGRLAGLARLSGAERILTNLMQLADICSKAEKEGSLDPHSLSTWFKKEKADPSKDDEKTLLLESDQNLVKIITIHSSKGLQFPVVFCPTLWEGRTKSKNMILEYHREEGGEAVLNSDQHGTEERKQAEQKSQFESVAEEVRKAYVAMTRARYACHLFWGAHSDSNYSGLGSLLIGRKEIEKSIGNNYKVSDKSEYSDETFLARLRKLSEEPVSPIQVELPDSSEPLNENSEHRRDLARNLQYKPYTGRINLPVQNKLESFSSLVHHKSETHKPDYDQVMDQYMELFGRDELNNRALNMFTFPRGATAGTAVHKLFEHDHFDFSEAIRADHSVLIEEVLKQYRIDTKWKPVIQQMLRDVAASKLPGVDLKKLQRHDELREMEFHFPAGEPDAGRLFQIIRNGNRNAAPAASAKRFMTGFIDLIVRQNGVYTIIDYKSNYLGDSPEDYQPDKLKPEMEAAGYDLQYHLYTAALKKYLEKRIPGFDYNKQFGGVAYLFVRGMKAGSENGVWFHKPDLSVIEELEHELTRATGGLVNKA